MLDRIKLSKMNKCNYEDWTKECGNEIKCKK